MGEDGVEAVFDPAHGEVIEERDPASRARSGKDPPAGQELNASSAE
jgi:hypothetical protein